MIGYIKEKGVVLHQAPEAGTKDDLQKELEAVGWAKSLEFLRLFFQKDITDIEALNLLRRLRWKYFSPD